jgi:hypothetical protein
VAIISLTSLIASIISASFPSSEFSRTKAFNTFHRSVKGKDINIIAPQEALLIEKSMRIGRLKQ